MVLKREGVAATPTALWRSGVPPIAVSGCDSVRRIAGSPSGIPVDTDTASMAWSLRASSTTRSTVRRTRASSHCCVRKFRTATPSRFRSMPGSCRASAMVYFTNIVATMKNPAEIATCQRSSVR